MPTATLNGSIALDDGRTIGPFTTSFALTSGAGGIGGSLGPATEATLAGTLGMNDGSGGPFSVTMPVKPAQQPPELGTGNPNAPAPPPEPAIRPGSSGKTITVRTTIADALAAAQPGDTVLIPPGTPEEAFAIDKPLLVEATGVVWDFSGGPLFQGKAAIVPMCNGWHIRGIEISGAGIHETESGLTCAIRVEADGHGTIEKCILHHNQNAIGAGNYNWIITVQDCDLHDNGIGDGLSHNLYCNTGHTLTVVNTISARPTSGHCLKSRAWHTNVYNCELGNVPDGACLDVPEGGLLHVTGTTFAKAANDGDRKFFQYGTENQNRGWLDNNLIDDCVMELMCNDPFATVAGGTVTFGPGCLWQGNPPEARGAGTIVGFP